MRKKLVIGAMAALLLGGAAALAAAREAKTPEREPLRLYSERGAETGSLYSGAWQQLTRLRLDETGGETDLEAGTYHLIRGDGGTVTFMLDETGAVTVSEGDGWGDGAALRLSDGPCGTLQVYCRVSGAAACRLEGGGTVRESVWETADGGPPFCRFQGLKPGTYALTAGDWSLTVTLHAGAMDRTAWLE